MVTATAQRRIWAGQPKQDEFFCRTEDEILYGGAAFGGKSEALLMFSIRRREKYPGSSGLILRRTFADLNKPGALIDRSHEVLEGRARWIGNEHRWVFSNGSVIQFGYLQHSDDKYHYQGTIFEDVCWDELSQFPNEADYQFVNAFCRTDIAGCKPLVRAATNPGGPGHAWVRGRFIDVAPPLTTYTDAHGRTRCFVPATAEDNPIGLALNPEYLAHLDSLPEAMSRALRHGDWDQFEGQVFSEWSRDVHVCTPFAIPSTWTRWVAIDYGYANPFCALWFARSSKDCTCYGEAHDHIYIYRELYLTGLRAQEQAREIKRRSVNERISMYPADPSMWAKREGVQGDNLAQEYQQEGITLTRANNDRIAGLNAVREALGVRRGPAQQIETVPRLRVFPGCINLIRTLPALPHDPIRVEDVDTDAEDHPYDALKYGLMALDGLWETLPKPNLQVQGWVAGGRR